MEYEAVTYRLPEHDAEEICETYGKYYAFEAKDKAKGAAEDEFYHSGEYGEIFPLLVEVLHKGEWCKFSVSMEMQPQFYAYEDEDE